MKDAALARTKATATIVRSNNASHFNRGPTWLKSNRFEHIDMTQTALH